MCMCGATDPVMAESTYIYKVHVNLTCATMVAVVTQFLLPRSETRYDDNNKDDDSVVLVNYNFN